jgi:NitT/TauT family transport system substrate-binding protein
MAGAAAVSLALLMGACTLEDLATLPPVATPTATPTPGLPETPAHLLVALGDVPDVRFAPFYLADARGWYRQAGLEVTFEAGPDPGLMTRVAERGVQLGVADGPTVIAARAGGTGVRTVATLDARFPWAVVAPATAGIGEPADLRGKRIGLPDGVTSASVVLRVLLATARLTPGDVTLVALPDPSATDALADGRVDAAVALGSAEALALGARGVKVTVLRVDPFTPLPGPGLVAADETIAVQREALRRFVAATVRAMDEIAADPRIALEAIEDRVPGTAGDREALLAALEAAIETWKSPYTLANGLGAVDRAAWAVSIDVMAGLPGLLAGPVAVDDVVEVELVPPR